MKSIAGLVEFLSPVTFVFPFLSSRNLGLPFSDKDHFISAMSTLTLALALFELGWVCFGEHF